MLKKYTDEQLLQKTKDVDKRTEEILFNNLDRDLTPEEETDLNFLLLYTQWLTIERMRRATKFIRERVRFNVSAKRSQLKPLLCFNLNLKIEIMIPTKEENPKGLHHRYNIEKADGTPVDEEAEYFVLRLDAKGKFPHVEAGRKAMKVYADEIESEIPELAKDLRRRYDLEKA